MSLDNLPQVSFCETDTATVQQNIITVYEGLTGKTLYPGDPVRLFLEALAAIIGQQRAAIDYAGKQNLLSLAGDDFLDHIGTFTDTPRLDEAAAVCTVRFSMDAALGFVVPIDAGTRVSPDGQLFFATSSYAEIAAGQTYVDVAVECQTLGSAGNGLVPGQVNKLVDPLDYVTVVENIDTTSGGADTEQTEPYRLRIHTAPESFSVAGPTGAYAHWAKTAHQSIADVEVYRTCPLDDLAEAQLEAVLDVAGIDYTGMDVDQKRLEVALWLSAATVNVCTLLEGGQVPGQSILDLVAAAVSDDRAVRPLSDLVNVHAPTPIDYGVEFTYFISSDNTVTATEIQAAVDAAVDDFNAWQRERLGRDINPDELNARVKAAGAKRLEIVQPVFTALEKWQVANLTAATVSYGGLEDE